MKNAKNSRRAGVAVDHENYEKDSFYETPASAVLALLSVEKFDGAIWENACGKGSISRILTDNRYEVISTDLVARGFGTPRVDFLMETRPLAPNIVTNPPYKLTNPFIVKGLQLLPSGGKMALLLRTLCLEGQGRGGIFKRDPPARIHVFSGRVVMWKNGEEPTPAKGKKNGGGMVSYSWFVWEKGFRGQTIIDWI